MKLTQTKTDATRFVEQFAQAVSALNSDYRRNRLAKGIRVEFVREVRPGLFASHNVICQKGTYYHGFCLTFHRAIPKPFLYSPFTAGGRFNHNYSVNRAFQLDLGRSPADPISPLRLSDSHRFRTGANAIVDRCTSESEVHLLPHHLAEIARGRSAVDALLTVLHEGYDSNEAARIAQSGVWNKQQLDCDLLRYINLYSQTHASRRNTLVMAVLGLEHEMFQTFDDLRGGEQGAGGERSSADAPERPSA